MLGPPTRTWIPPTWQTMLYPPRRARLAQQIAVALASLPKADYDVLTLHLWAELSHREIATALRIPVGTVKSRLNRARREVRAQLGPATRWR